MVNSAAVMSPSGSLPVQVNVTVYGGVPLAGSTTRSTHTGLVFPGFGVGVGVDVGVGDGVGPSVGVGVGVGLAPVVGVDVGVLGTEMEKESLQAEATACGVSCGTVGATGACCSSFVLVTYATTPMPTVMMVTRIRYQYFLKNDIG